MRISPKLKVSILKTMSSALPTDDDNDDNNNNDNDRQFVGSH